MTTLCTRMCLELLELWAQSQRDLQWLQHSALLRRVLSTQGLGDSPRRLLHSFGQATGWCAPCVLSYSYNYVVTSVVSTLFKKEIATPFLLEQHCFSSKSCSAYKFY